MAEAMSDVRADFDRLAHVAGGEWDHNPGAQVRRHLLWRYSVVWKKAA